MASVRLGGFESASVAKAGRAPARVDDSRQPIERVVAEGGAVAQRVEGLQRMPRAITLDVARCTERISDRRQQPRRIAEARCVTQGVHHRLDLACASIGRGGLVRQRIRNTGQIAAAIVAQRPNMIERVSDTRYG